MARSLVMEGSTGPDVLDAYLRLNLAGANPQVAPADPFDAHGVAAAKQFQAAHGLAADGKIGDDTWALLDQLDGGRLVSAARVGALYSARQQARDLLAAGDFASVKALLDPIYAEPGVPPEVLATVTANLGWAEHGLGNFDRARDLYSEQLGLLLLFGQPLLARDTLQRIHETMLGQPPGPLPSVVNRENLPPNG